MKKLFYLFLIIGLAIISCNKPDVLPTEVEVSFQTSMGGTNFKAGGDPISAFDCNTDGATYAILVINDVSYTVDLIRDDDGSVYTQSIKLPVLASGVKYELTSFMLYDDDDNLILASPNSNAPFGEFVTAGLPIDFEVDGFYKVNIPIQVLCYTPTTIIEFGFSWFSFETVTVRELCFFGDICVDIDDYVGSIYEGQLYGLQHDMPAIFKVEISMWNDQTNDWDNPITEENNSSWLGEGAALCVQYPDYEGVDTYKIELLVLVSDGNGGFEYQSFLTWNFEDDNFPVTDKDGDGVIDFVIGDCVPNADIIIVPEDPTPPTVECDDCDGHVSALTLLYIADDGNSHEIRITDEENYDETFTVTSNAFSLPDLSDTKNTIYLYVDDVLNTDIHLSCSQPIMAGLTFGDFYVVTGASTDGGAFCSVSPLAQEETAYAYDSKKAICFIDIPEITTNNWGWSNGKYKGEDNNHYNADNFSPYKLILFAGAGGCDLSAATPVGNLELAYNKQTGHVIVTYNAGYEVVFQELHLYVGYTKHQVGNESVALGQFPYKAENLSGDDRKTYTFEFDLDDNDNDANNNYGEIYIIAHAVAAPSAE